MWSLHNKMGEVKQTAIVFIIHQNSVLSDTVMGSTEKQTHRRYILFSMNNDGVMSQEAHSSSNLPRLIV